MVRWAEVAVSAPELAEAARALFEARVHKTLATLRKDGSPRISGTECEFVDGDLWFGSMWQARKAFDLQRDPRFALHSGSIDPPDWRGDAKIAGRAEEVTDPDVLRSITEAAESPPGSAHHFRADITEVVVVRLGDPADHLVIDVWTEGQGLRSIRRE